VPEPGQVLGEATREMGRFLRDVMKLNTDHRNFRVFGPDETTSNRLGALFEVTNRAWMAQTLDEDDHLATDGRVMEILRQQEPELKIRVINVVNLMTLQPEKEHPHGLSDKEFDALFTTDKPIIFVYHGYPWLIHRLTYRRTNHKNLHVRGYKEEGTTTTPFDMAVRNDLDRFHLVADVIDRVPKLGYLTAYTKQLVRDKLIEHRQYINRYGEDMPEIRDWKWGG